jgi:hypothetical protein
LEVVGNGDSDPPGQIAATCVNVGVVGVFTVMVIVAAVAHWPVAGVNVYVVVAALLNAGDHVPEIPLMEVVGSGDIGSPEHIEVI